MCTFIYLCIYFLLVYFFLCLMVFVYFYTRTTLQILRTHTPNPSFYISLNPKPETRGPKPSRDTS